MEKYLSAHKFPNIRYYNLFVYLKYANCSDSSGHICCVQSIFHGNEEEETAQDFECIRLDTFSAGNMKSCTLNRFIKTQAARGVFTDWNIIFVMM